MASRKLWTAVVATNSGIFKAQCKASRKELLKRLAADDPLWAKGDVSIEHSLRWSKKYFNNGLAIRFTVFPGKNWWDLT